MELRIKYLLIGLLILISSPFALYASHLVGGKITYRYLGSNKYEYTMTVYRDCSDQIDFSSPALIHIYDKGTNMLTYVRNVPLTNRSAVPPISPNPCFVPPAGICVEVGRYIDTVTLAPNAAGYTITHQNCCHNGSVLNVIAPTASGMVITTDVPPLINNSSTFNNYPPIYICVSDTFKYSFASTDVDGDSLVYQLCTPYKDGTINYSGPFVPTPPPYNPLGWVGGFSATNPISNSGGITFNASTGQLKFKPALVGQFAIGICVLEYRAGNLITTNRLELQFNIVNCYLVSSIPTATNLCEGLTINFQNSSTNANSFYWNFGDNLTVIDTSSQLTPTYTFPSYGTYTVMLVASNTAYGACKDTSYKVINVNPLLSPTLQPTYTSCFNNNSVNFDVGGSYHPSANFNWNVGSHGNITSPINNSVFVHFTSASTQTVNVIVNQFGCMDTLKAIVTFSNPIASINGSNLDCNGLNLNFSNFSSNASYFQWDFGVAASTVDTSTLYSPTFSYPSYGNYTVTLIASDGNCTDTLRLPVIVQPTLALFPVTSVPQQCLKNNSFNFSANGMFGPLATFNWIFIGGTPATSNQQNPTNVHFTTPGTHGVKFSISENGCVRIRTQAVKVLPSPPINLVVHDTIGCQPLTINFKNLTDSTHSVYNTWFVQSNIFNDSSFNYTYQDTGLYSFTIAVRDSNNCMDTLARANYIRVLPTPIAKAYVTPLQTNLLFPQITFIDSTFLSHNTFFNFGDGSTSELTTNYYNYKSPGEFPYSLIVTNSYGCSDTTSGIIKIDDVSFYDIPNIFTPNNDGVNELFKIRGESITQAPISIFNRWGALVFEGDALKGWNGINANNGEPCSAGTFFYIIKITLDNNKSYSFNGTVQLQR